MANSLTWRDVAAPNLSTSLEALNTAQRGMGGAFSGLSDALGKWQTGQQDAAAAALQANLLKLPDVAAQRAAIADGSLFNGVNKDYLTAAAYGAPDSRASTLLNQQHTELGNQFDSRSMDTRLGQQSANLAQTLLSNQFSRQTLPDRVAMEHTRLDQSNQTLYDAKYKQSKLEENDNSSDITDEIGAQAAQNATNEDDVRRAVLNAKDKDGDPLSADDRAKAIKKGIALLPSYNGNGNAAGGTAPAGGAPGSTNKAASSVADAVKPNYGPGVGLTGVIDIPEARDYVRKAIVQGGDNSEAAVFDRAVAGKNSIETSGRGQFDKDGKVIVSSAGAVGISQMKPETGPEAAQMAGLPWDPDRFRKDEGYNLALGKAYFHHLVQRYGGDTALAAAAYNAGMGRADQWAKLAPGQLMSENQGINSRLDTLGSRINERNNQNNANGIQGILFDHMGPDGTLVQGTESKRDTTKDDAIKTLMTSFQGVSRNDLSKQIDAIETQAKKLGGKSPSYATIAEIIKNAGRTTSNNPFNMDGDFFHSGGIYTDPDSTKAYIDALNQGTSSGLNASNNGNMAQEGNANRAKALLNTAYNDLVQTQKRAEYDDEARKLLPEKIDAYRRAQSFAADVVKPHLDAKGKWVKGTGKNADPAAPIYTDASKAPKRRPGQNAASSLLGQALPQDPSTANGWTTYPQLF